MRVLLCFLILNFFHPATIALQPFQATNQHIRFLERALEESAVVNAFANGGRVRCADGTPNWLRRALAKDQFDLGLHNYLTGIFEACHSTVASFEKCLGCQNDYPQITSALLYGSIVHVLLTDVNIAFRPHIRLRPFHNINMANAPMHQLVSLFVQHTWTAMVNDIRRYDDSVHVVSMAAYVANTFQGASAFVMQGNDALLLRAWWSSLRAQYQLAQSLFATYQLWLRDVMWWDDSSRAFMLAAERVEESDRHAPITLYDRTRRIEHRLRHSPYFKVEVSNLQPFRHNMEKVLQTGRCALVLREYCDLYEPNLKLYQSLLAASYVNHPELMRVLSEALLDRDIHLGREQSHGSEGTTVSELSGRIVSQCLQNDASLQICEVVATMWPPLYFYISEGLVLREFYNSFPLLLQLQHFARFAIDDFNTYLARLYMQLRYFFQIQPDVLLEAWAHNTQGTTEMRDLYQVFKGHDVLWDARPPITLLQHKIDFNRFTLRFFWHRAIDLFRAHIAEWWKSLLIMARQFDKWVARTDCEAADQFLKGQTLYDTLRAVTLIEAIQTMHNVAINLRVWSDEKLVPDVTVDRQLAWQVVDVRGHIEAFRSVFAMCERRYFGIKVSRPTHAVNVPPLPNVPPQSALLHAQQDKHRTVILDENALRRGVPIVINEAAGSSSAAINFLEDSPRSSRSAKSAKKRMALSIKSKKSIKSIKNLFRPSDNS